MSVSISNNISNINTKLSKRLSITETDISIIKNNIYSLENTLNDIKNSGIDLTPIISDITDIKNNINDISRDLLTKIENNLSKINELKSKDINFADDISKINEDISHLYSEDAHIFRLIEELQSVNKTIRNDLDFIKEDNKKILEFDSPTGFCFDIMKIIEDIAKSFNYNFETTRKGCGIILFFL